MVVTRSPVFWRAVSWINDYMIFYAFYLYFIICRCCHLEGACVQDRVGGHARVESSDSSDSIIGGDVRCRLLLFCVDKFSAAFVLLCLSGGIAMISLARLLSTCGVQTCGAIDTIFLGIEVIHARNDLPSYIFVNWRHTSCIVVNLSMFHFL